MAEAEDVITDAARHATVFARDLWRRHRPAKAGPLPVGLQDQAARLDLLLAAVFGRSFALRVAQAPAPRTWLHGLFGGRRTPAAGPVPATDGESLWLPAFLDGADPAGAIERYRVMALQQAMRAVRGGAALRREGHPLAVRELHLLLEARAADDALARLLPGLAQPLRRLRTASLMRRPAALVAAPAHRRIEAFLRELHAADAAPVDGRHELPAIAGSIDGPLSLPLPASAAEVLQLAERLAVGLADTESRHAGGMVLWRDAWTGELRMPPPTSALRARPDDADDDGASGHNPRSARLARRPDVREAPEDEDDASPGAWMVQPSPPHEQAEDPMGLQRPTDRDVSTAAEDYADALSELAEARLVVAPGKPKEVLLSDDPPPGRTHGQGRAAQSDAGETSVSYPEWDWTVGAYREPGATVRLTTAPHGPQAWVDQTLERRRGMLDEIRRRFELLRARRVRLPRQVDGDDIDLPAWIEGLADVRAGLPMADRLYQAERRARRDMAIVLLVDISGSTDGWIAADRRVIDVEREALLLVCIALEGLGEPYGVLAFSGEGPANVVVREVKRFDERYGSIVAQRIAGLEPEHYTRVGAAIRHATSVVLRQPAAHRLLLLLSDGKPNDVDDYEGRYGVEDMRQAVAEATLQGISPFCLTVDRQAAGYLASVFGRHRYALLSEPERLPVALLDWLQRLVSQ